LTLADYVKKRNGVPLGASESLRNMLSRSLGAETFAIFWQFWNPIWGYYLGKFIFKPLKGILPQALALIITFAVSGFIHDLAIMLLKKKFTLLLTPWFLFMGLVVVLGELIGINYSKFPWIIRALINIVIISICLLGAYQVRV
jgi:hypothetical protein